MRLFIAMNKTLWLRLIAISGALSVMFGAFGAHGLEDRLSASYLDTFNTAVRYQILHSLALLGIICLPDHLVKLRTLHWVAISFAAGVLLFSGSLYLLVLFDSICPQDLIGLLEGFLFFYHLHKLFLLYVCYLLGQANKL